MKKDQFGKRIKIARLRKNLRQIDVATALLDYEIAINQSTLGKIERGERNLLVYELVALAEILDISTEWIIKGGDLDID